MCDVCAHVTLVLSLSVGEKTGDAFCVGSVPLDFSSTNSSPLYAPSPQSSPPALHPCTPCGQHMREAAERRQQLELEHEQALAVLNAKQQEIDLLQKVRQLRVHTTLAAPEGGAFLFAQPAPMPVSWVKELFVKHWCDTCSATKVKVNSKTVPESAEQRIQ